MKKDIQTLLYAIGLHNPMIDINTWLSASLFKLLEVQHKGHC